MIYLQFAKPVDPNVVKIIISTGINLNHTDNVLHNSALHFADRNPTT